MNAIFFFEYSIDYSVMKIEILSPYLSRDSSALWINGNVDRNFIWCLK